MELTTRCPNCDTVFSVGLEQLQLRKGYIRCVQCAHIFDGFDAVVPGESSHARTAGPAVEPTIAGRGSDLAAGAPLREPTLRDPGATPLTAHPASVQPSASPAFIIPPPDPSRPDGPQPARPFSIGGAGSSAAAIDEPRLPSVLRQRGDMKGAKTQVAPSFTITDRRAGPMERRNEPGFVDRKEDAVYIAEPVTELADPVTEPPVVKLNDERARSNDYLFIEPRSGRRPDHRKPEYFDGARKRRPWMTPVWAVLIVCGLLALLLQGVYVYRSQLANAFPGLRPSLESACERIGCSVPYERRIDAIAITGSALRAKAAPRDGVSALTLEVTLRNTYVRPQEWPTLVLDLKDASGAVVVRRNLGPDAWVPAELRDGPFEAERELTVHVPVAVKGLQANGYQLDKFFP